MLCASSCFAYQSMFSYPVVHFEEMLSAIVCQTLSNTFLFTIILSVILINCWVFLLNMIAYVVVGKTLETRKGRGADDKILYPRHVSSIRTVTYLPIEVREKHAASAPRRVASPPCQFHVFCV